MHLAAPSTGLVSALLVLALAACGGGGSDDATPLFDANGQPAASARQQPDASTTTRSGLFATRAQVEWEALTAAPYTVLVDLDASASPADALAKALADHAFAEAQHHAGVAHFVRGGSPEQAAAVVDALGANGVAPVFLVVG